MTDTPVLTSARLQEIRKLAKAVLKDNGQGTLLDWERVELAEGFLQAEAALAVRAQEIEQKDAEIERLRDWQATVTAALRREGGSFYEDVPKHVRQLRSEVDALRQTQAHAPQELREALELLSAMMGDEATIDAEDGNQQAAATTKFWKQQVDDLLTRAGHVGSE